MVAVATAHAEVEDRRCDDAGDGDLNAAVGLNDVQCTEVLLHDLQVSRFPQALILLFMVIDHRFEEA
ncbi:hypothetical protein D3C71_2192300 [compost metagenome]